MASVIPVSTWMNGGSSCPGDHRVELAQHHAATDLDGTDLGDPAVRRGAAGGLQVDDHEVTSASGVPSSFERGLARKSGGVGVHNPVVGMGLTVHRGAPAFG